MMMLSMMSGLTCRQIAEGGSRFIDGELHGVEWVRFRLHMISCAPCNAYIRQLGITVDALRDLPGPDGKQVREDVLDVFDQWAKDQSSPDSSA